MAAYSDILPQPMLDLTNFNDDIPPVVTNGTLLDATRMVLEEDNTAEWIVDMLSLTRYYRVNFKHRKTVQKFIWHCLFLADNKENQAYTEEQLDILHKIVCDLTKWIDRRKCEALDESHWPVDHKYLVSLDDIYGKWKNATFRRVKEWHDRMIAIKQELERESTPERGLSMRDIFNSHIRCLQEQNPGLIVHRHVPQHVSDTDMYVDGNLIPPPLQTDMDTEYTVV